MDRPSTCSIAEKLDDEQALARLAAALWARVGLVLKRDDLRWAQSLLGLDGDRKLWTALSDANALQGEPPVLEATPLHAFLGELNKGQTNGGAVELPYELVWTLPSTHPEAPSNGLTYVRAIADVIRRTQRRLLIVSPFLGSTGIALLHEELLHALSRGVSITLLTHDATNLASLQSKAIEVLRRDAARVPGSIAIYTVAADDEGSRTVQGLVHAKLVIGDESRLVLGSANLTGQGLSANFEAGVRLGSRAAREATTYVVALLESKAVNLAFKIASPRQ